MVDAYVGVYERVLRDPPGRAFARPEGRLDPKSGAGDH
jgi:hypothetical protein